MKIWEGLDRTKFITVKSGDKSITLMNGIEKNRIWLEKESGEGGDFEEDKLFEALSWFYDRYF